MERNMFKFRVQNSDDVVRNQYHLFLQKAKAIYWEGQTNHSHPALSKEEGDDNFKIYQLSRKMPSHRNTLGYKSPVWRNRGQGAEDPYQKHHQAFLRQQVRAVLPRDDLAHPK